MSSLLEPAFVDPKAVGSGELVFCFDFGFGTEENPCATNVALAAFFFAYLFDDDLYDLPCFDGSRVKPRARPPPKILAQRGIAKQLDEFGIEVFFVLDSTPPAPCEESEASGTPSGAVPADAVEAALAEFSARAPCSIFGGTPVTLLAHPGHAWRCWLLATMAGYSVIAPGVPGKFEWQGFGCDPWGFSPMAADERFRDEEAWSRYEVPLQRRLAAQYPGIGATQLRQRLMPATATPVEITRLEGAVFWLLCCGCVPGWEERAGLPGRPGAPSSSQPLRLQRAISMVPSARSPWRPGALSASADGSPSARGADSPGRRAPVDGSPSARGADSPGRRAPVDGSPSARGDDSPGRRSGGASADGSPSAASQEDELDEDDIIPVWHPRIGPRDMLSSERWRALTRTRP